jgi:hypothetical protein
MTLRYWSTGDGIVRFGEVPPIANLTPPTSTDVNAGESFGPLADKAIADLNDAAANVADITRLTPAERADRTAKLRAKGVPADTICDRCSLVGQVVDRIDLSTFAEPRGSRVYVNAICDTPGCVDETGSPVIQPPDVPGQLTNADRAWIRRHNQLANDLGYVTHRLHRLMDELGIQ